MHVNDFPDSPELSAMRRTRFYTELRPYIHARLVPNKTIENLLISEESEGRLSIEDRYLVKLDVLFGQLFKNCKTGLFWKMQLTQLTHADAVSCLSIEALDKAYLNELVVLFERLGRFTSLLKNAFGKDVDVTDLEMLLLGFFNPLLFSKRNYAHHRLYLGFPGMVRLQSLEENAVDEESFNEYYSEFQARLNEILNWVSDTERELSILLKSFLDLLHLKIRPDRTYISPIYLAPNFSLSDRLEVDIRQRHDHNKIFAERNSGKALREPATS